jgi:hypothetical protein
LVGGETTVYYWRAEPGNYDNPPDVPGSCDDGNRDSYRAQYLARLMDPTYARISLDPYPSITITWKDAVAYKVGLMEALQERRAQFQRAVARLQESGLLLPAEIPALKPCLEVVILDERTDRSIPLPTLQPDEQNTSIRSAFSRPLN